MLGREELWRESTKCALLPSKRAWFVLCLRTGSQEATGEACVRPGCASCSWRLSRTLPFVPEQSWGQYGVPRAILGLSPMLFQSTYLLPALSHCVVVTAASAKVKNRRESAGSKDAWRNRRKEVVSTSRKMPVLNRFFLVLLFTRFLPSQEFKSRRPSFNTAPHRTYFLLQSKRDVSIPTVTPKSTRKLHDHENLISRPLDAVSAQITALYLHYASLNT